MVSSEIAFLECKANEVPPKLSPRQVQALHKLKSYSQLTIKPADKGGCIVVLDNDRYKQMCLDILNNTVWYRPITFEMADHFMVEFYHLVDEAFHAGTINKHAKKIVCSV